MEESQAVTVLGDALYDDPSQLSQALRQRACSDKPFHFTTSPDSHTALLHLPVALARLHHAPSPRRAAHAKHVKPALSKHHSAPTNTGFVSEVEGKFNMYHSFNGMDAPGDTQPDSQMLKTYTSGIYSTVEVTNNPKSLFIEHGDEDDGDLPTDELDVVQSSQEHHDPAVTSPTVIDVDDQGEYAQDSMAPTSPLKFQTPGVMVRRRDSSGPVLSSVVRTNTTPATLASPSAFFPAAFGNGGFGGGNNISLTQAFNNTQAPTSPAVGGANDDVAFTRPSPNFTNARHSSPIPAYSSPIKANRPDTPKSDPIVRSSSEPRAEYVTMKQSQEKRKYSVRDKHDATLEQDSWDELELSRQLQAKKLKEHLHRQAAKSLSHISAPMSASPRSGKKQMANTGYPSPVKSKASRSRIYDGQQDEDDFMDELSQPTEVKEHHAEESPDGISQGFSTARTTVKPNSNDNRVQVPKTSSHPYQTPSNQPSRASSQQASPSSQLQRESQSRAPASQSLLRGTFRPQSSKESVAVMDSQPDATAHVDSISRPKPLRFPSSPSINQYSINQTTMATKTGFTSQVISSSMPPMPPKSSPDQEIQPEEAERVPSSPPLLPDEADVEYDEHTYNEYAEGVEDHEDTEPPATDEDIVMDEEEDLPSTKEEPEDEPVPDVPGDGLEGDETDLVEPGKVDMGTDQVVPETLEKEQPEDDSEDDRQSQQDVIEEPPRMQRQNTVPETDALDETQPSFFPDNIPKQPAEDTNSTVQFQTAQEQQSGSQTVMPVPLSSRETGSETLQGGHRIRSIDDIYNLPDTQQSAPEEEIEMPQLSDVDEEVADTFMSRSSPERPSKRRKVTNMAKRKTFLAPSNATTDTGPLSDPPASPQLQRIHQALEDTPPTASALEREDQGARAVTRAREEVQGPYVRTTSLKSRAGPRPTRPRNQKKGSLKPISRNLFQTLSSPAVSPARPKGSIRSRESSPVTPTKPREQITEKTTDVDMTDVNTKLDEPTRPQDQPTGMERVLETLSQRTTTPIEDIIVPNRVFASWPGSHYYPATCVGRATTRQLQVRYDDGNTTSMDTVHVRALDLRRGDHVKVDETGMKKHTYVVVGFKDKIGDLDGEEFPVTDRSGHTTVVLEERPRDSLPKVKAIKPAEHISVPVGSIYLTTGLWKRLRDRTFNFSPPMSPAKVASRIGTPVADAVVTPSFTRRGTAAPSLLRDTATRAASVASTARSGSGVFANMAFVLTSTAADVDKEAMAKVIKTNGGQVLDHGFHELFAYESTEVSSSQGRRRSASVEESPGLVLKHTYKDLGFVALISDSHSRSTKYIQALALNVPCLHLRWVQDSLTTSRARPFMRYLLPAGVSKFLDPNGVVRSRTMTPYDPAGENVSFAQIIQDRDLLLLDQSVLLITGKSKKEIEKRQPFVFLSHALGSANVGRCADLAAASEMLHDGKWDWVYVDMSESGVAEAASELFGTAKPVKKAKGKKRKRADSEEKEALLLKGEISGRTVRITCAEFVIQSLILGALVQE